MLFLQFYHFTIQKTVRSSILQLKCTYAVLGSVNKCSGGMQLAVRHLIKLVGMWNTSPPLHIISRGTDLFLSWFTPSFAEPQIAKAAAILELRDYLCTVK